MAHKVIGVIRNLLMFCLMVFVWLLLVMTYFRKFIPPFDSLSPYLMPWEGLYKIPYTATLSESLSLMQGILDASGRVAEISLLVLVMCFTAFSGYLTYVYQQRQRRAEENRMLRIKNQEISRRGEFIRYISATISHEFKNNLGRIKRRIDLLDSISPVVRERLDGNLGKLFADIDIFKKISDEREASLISFTMVNLKEMLKGLKSQYADFADIELKETDAPSTIFASQPLLKTVFDNLLDNAIKYKKPGDERACITLSYGMDFDGRRRYVSLSFKDEGIGMDELQADKCFYKGISISGWGEGLYFAKYVIGLHAGKIRVGKEHTAPNSGTEIIIHLPYVEETLNV